MLLSGCSKFGIAYFAVLPRVTDRLLCLNEAVLSKANASAPPRVRKLVWFTTLRVDMHTCPFPTGLDGLENCATEGPGMKGLVSFPPTLFSIARIGADGGLHI